MSYIEHLAEELGRASVAHVLVLGSVKSKLEKALVKLSKSDEHMLWRNGVTLDGASIKLTTELRRPNKSGLQVTFILRDALDALKWFQKILNLDDLKSDIMYIEAIKDFSVNSELKITGEIHDNLNSLAKRLSEIADITLEFLNDGGN
jgi:hypothetical protein